MYGSDVRTFASASRWLDWENNELLPPQHEMVMDLIRLPEPERDAKTLAHARAEFARRLDIVESVLAGSRHMCGERFSCGDIPIGLRVHRWRMPGLASGRYPNIDRWYREITARPAFQAWTARPEYHLEG